MNKKNEYNVMFILLSISLSFWSQTAFLFIYFWAIFATCILFEI